MATVTKLETSWTGTAAWQVDLSADQGEGTDLAVASDGTSAVVVGHGGGSNGLSGRLTKISTADGEMQWTTKIFSTPFDGTAGPHAALLKNECWGVSVSSNGYVVGCGSGVEDCDGLNGSLKTACENGTADQRPGAYARGKGVWQSMVAKIDLEGGLEWQRVDQLKLAHEPQLGESGWQKRSSASEYVFQDASGAIVAVNDEVGGVGLLKFLPA